MVKIMMSLIKLTGVFIFFSSIAVLVLMGMIINYLFEKYFGDFQ